VVTVDLHFVRLENHDSIMGQADEAAAGNQSEIRCLSRLEPCRCLRETVRIGTGTPPREAVRAMFASALRERNGQASNGILWPCARGDRRKGRDRCPWAAGTDRKPWTQSPSSDRVERVAAERRCPWAWPGRCSHSRDGTERLRATGPTRGDRAKRPSGSCRLMTGPRCRSAARRDGVARTSRRDRSSSEPPPSR
jgi:hypothetical protein